MPLRLAPLQSKVASGLPSWALLFATGPSMVRVLAGVSAGVGACWGEKAGLPVSVPTFVKPDAVTVLPVPTVLFVKLALAELPSSVTVSPETTPTRLGAGLALIVASGVPS